MLHRMPIYLAVTLTLSTLATDTHAKVIGAPVRYEAKGVSLNGFLAFDDAIKGKRPGVLVVHEWWGHNEYARQRAKMLAEMGYVALAIDMYGDGKQAAHPSDAMKFMSAVMSDIKTAEARFDAAYALLNKHKRVKKDRIAAIGYCFGGGVVLHMARSGRKLRGVASFHGSLATKVPAKKGAIKGQIFVAHGAADPMSPEQQVTAFKKEMKDAGVKLKFIAYPGAKHAFTNPAADELGKKFKLPLAYNKAADEGSWNALKGFLKQVMR